MELRMYLDVVGRRWRTVLLVAVIFAGLGAVASRFILPTYEAQVMLRIVTPLGGSSSDTNYQTAFATRLMNTYAQIALSEQAANELRSRLGRTTLPHVNVKLIPDSEIIQVIAQGGDPALVAETANGLADILLSYQGSAESATDSKELDVLAQRKAELEAQLAGYQQRYNELSQAYSQKAAEIAVLDGQITMRRGAYQNLQNQYEQAAIADAVASSSASRATRDAIARQLDVLQNDLDSLDAQYKNLSQSSNEYLQQITLLRQTIQSTENAYSDLLAQLDNVTLANLRQENSQNVMVVSPASVPREPTGLSGAFVLGLGILGGLIAGIGAAFLMENLDTRIVSYEQVARLTDLPLISSVTTWPSGSSDHNPAEDAFRTRDYSVLCMALQRAIERVGARTIMIVSPNRMEGKSTIVYNLALEFAHNERRVLVVDADLRVPAQGRLFGVTCRRGLGTFLSEQEQDIKGMILKEAMPGIDLLPSFARRKDAGELARSAQLAALFDAVKTYDIVLLDTSAILPVPDALELAKFVDAVLLVVRWGQTTGDDVKAVARQLEPTGAKLLGLVLNQVPSRKPSDYYQPAHEPSLAERARKLISSSLGRLSRRRRPGTNGKLHRMRRQLAGQPAAGRQEQ